MLGNIIRLWIITPDKVASFGHNSVGTRVGFQLKWGAEWTEIPLIRDTSSESGSISDVSNSDFKFTAVSMLISMKMLGQRYVCKYMTNTGATYIVGNGRAFVLNGCYTTGKQPGDVAGITLSLQGDSHYPDQWLVEIPAEKPVDPPEPPIIDPLIEHFENTAGFKVYAFGDTGFVELALGQVVKGASWSQPAASIIRLQLGPAEYGSQIHVIRWFDAAKSVIGTRSLNITNVYAETPFNYSSNGSVDAGEVYARSAYYNTMNEPNGSTGSEFIPSIGVLNTNNNYVMEKSGFGISLHKGGDSATHYIDIDYMQWTFA